MHHSLMDNNKELFFQDNVSEWIERAILHIADKNVGHYIPSQKDALPFRSTRVHTGFCEAHFAQSLSFFL
jgi:hypothetical protein